MHWDNDEVEYQQENYSPLRLNCRQEWRDRALRCSIFHTWCPGPGVNSGKSPLSFASHLKFGLENTPQCLVVYEHSDPPWTSFLIGITTRRAATRAPRASIRGTNGSARQRSSMVLFAHADTAHHVMTTRASDNGCWDGLHGHHVSVLSVGPPLFQKHVCTCLWLEKEFNNHDVVGETVNSAVTVP